MWKVEFKPKWGTQAEATAAETDFLKILERQNRKMGSIVEFIWSRRRKVWKRSTPEVTNQKLQRSSFQTNILIQLDVAQRSQLLIVILVGLGSKPALVMFFLSLSSTSYLLSLVVSFFKGEHFHWWCDDSFNIIDWRMQCLHGGRHEASHSAVTSLNLNDPEFINFSWITF